MIQLLWIGSFIWGEALTEARKRGYGNPASVQSQTNLVEGLEKAYENVFDTIGALVLPPYPKNKTMYFDEINFSHYDGANDCIVGYNNIQYLNKLSTKRRLCNKIKEWAYLHKEDDVEVFVYEMRSACLYSAYMLKKIIPSARINLIVPDLPIYMDLRMNRLKAILKKLDWCSIQSLLGIVDNYVLYADTMANYLKLEDKKWMLMEGSINVNDIKELPVNQNEHDRFVVMYSGHVEERFGIQNLIDAFQFLPNNFELWITGKGNMTSFIEEKSAKDNRIKYFGFLPKREDLLKLQSGADVFINMRDPNEPASHYCFPSKLFEYMLTGKPVLTCKLKGIPKEYFNYLYTIDGISAKEIAAGIDRVSKIELKERQNKGTNARNYIIREKNNLVQCRRIKEFLEFNHL